MWLGAYPVTQVYVTSNGYINIDRNDNPPSTYRWDGRADPISLASASLPSGISVAHEDLNPNASTASIVITQYDSIAGSFTISYQGVPFWPSNGTMNAQAVLWADGTVDIRWGALSLSIPLSPSPLCLLLMIQTQVDINIRTSLCHIAHFPKRHTSYSELQQTLYIMAFFLAQTLIYFGMVTVTNSSIWESQVLQT